MKNEKIKQAEKENSLKTNKDEVTILHPEEPYSAQDEKYKTWRVGDLISELYIITEELGEGGMGKVFKAHHKGWDIDLAIKSPRPEILSDEKGKENFIREAETWVNLGLHPNIVSCYYIRIIDDLPRVFAEYIDGGNLKEWIQTGKLYHENPEKSLEIIMDIAIQFAWGLQYAHENGLVHQDIKPANLMLTVDGLAKVTDFGLARARAMAGEKFTPGSHDNILVSSGGMTPAYASPEQLAGEPLNSKTDIWSFGVSLLEMFTGEVTWMSGAIVNEVFENYLLTGTDKVEIPKMPASLINLLKKCFQKNLGARPDSMREIANIIKNIYQDITGSFYQRLEPKSIELLSDSLNNKAISLIDIGKKDEAIRIFNDAYNSDTTHPELTYNYGLILWRSGEIADDELLRRLDSIKKTRKNAWECDYFTALIHSERGDNSSALTSLQRTLSVLNSTGIRNTEVLNFYERIKSESQAEERSKKVFGSHGRISFMDLPSDKKPIGGLDVSKDGRFLVSCSDDGTVILWDIPTAKSLVIFEGNAGEVKSVCFSPDGMLILSGYENGVMILWDVFSKKYIKHFNGHTKGVISICFSPDGKFALSGSSDETLRLWNISEGNCIKLLKGHEWHVNSVKFLNDGKHGISGSQDWTIRIWDLSSGECIKILKEQRDSVNEIYVTKDNRYILAGCGDKKIRLWDLATDKCVKIYTGHLDGIASLNISSDGKFILSSSYDKTIRLWGFESGKCIKTLNYPVEVNTAYHTKFINNEKQCISGGYDQNLYIWDLSSGNQSQFILVRPRRSLELEKHTFNFRMLIDKTEECLKSEKIKDAVNYIEQCKVIPGFNRSAKLLDLWQEIGLRCRRTGIKSAWHVKTIGEHDCYISSDFSSNAKYCITNFSTFKNSTNNYVFRLWDVENGNCIKTFEGSSKTVHSFSFSKDGKLIFGVYNGAICILESSSGEVIKEFKSSENKVYTISNSNNDRYIISGNNDNTIGVWNCSSGNCVREIKITFGSFLEQYSNDSLRRPIISNSQRLIIVSSKKKIGVWNLASGETIKIFEIPNIISLIISPDERYIISAHEDMKIRIWNLFSGKCIKIIESPAKISSIYLSPNGKEIYTKLEFTFNYCNILDEISLKPYKSGSRSEWAMGNIYDFEISPDGKFGLAGMDKNVCLIDMASHELLLELERHTGKVTSVSFSKDCRYCLSEGMDKSVRLWELEWDYEYPEDADWDFEVEIYLENFLILHLPILKGKISKNEKPLWNEDDFKDLLDDLRVRGYGWIKTGEIKSKLHEMGEKGLYNKLERGGIFKKLFG